MKSLATRALFAAILFLALPSAHAGLILDLQTGGTPIACGPYCGPLGSTFGWSFTVKNTIKVTSIGVWDAGSDGIGTSTQAGVFTSTGVLLGSAIISDASTPVASSSADGRWLFEDFAPLVLTPGEYLIGNVFLEFLPSAQVRAPFTTIPQVTLGGGVMNAPAAGFGAPLLPFTSPIFGATLQASEVPEPASLLLCGLGLSAIVCRKRRKV